MRSVARHAHCVSVFDLEFATRSVKCATNNGTPYWREVAFGMPKIPREFIRTCVFMYRTKKDAEIGKNKCGTGFLVSMPTPDPARVHAYIVSNWHVVRQKGASCFAIARKDGGVDAYEFDPSEWEFDAANGYDICARSVPNLDPKIHEMTFVPSAAFLTAEGAKKLGIGPGDDIFMMGLFVTHSAADNATPAARFGHISMDPSPIQLETGKAVDCYCADTNSRTGFSGSPVFVYRTPGQDLTQTAAKEMKDQVLLVAGRNHLSLLGIHVGQFPDEWEIKNGKVAPGTESANDVMPQYIKGLSGITVVIPAWKILEVLNMEKIKSNREALDEQIRDSSPVRPVAESNVLTDDLETRTLKTMLNTPPKPHETGD